MAVPEAQFDSGFFFENATYSELLDEVYNPRKKNSRQEFLRFICANLKELEFKKEANKSDGLCYSFIVENVEDTTENKQIRVYPNENDGKDDIQFAVFEKVNRKWVESEEEKFKDISCERDNGTTFTIMMDRTMDCLEVLEKRILGMECDIQLNISKDDPQIKKAVSPKKSPKKKSASEDYHPSSEDDDDDDAQGDDSEEEEDKDKKKTKGRRRRGSSGRSNRKKKKTNEESDNDDDSDNNEEDNKKKKAKRTRKKRKRKELSDNDGSDDDDDNNGFVKAPPKRKRRKYVTKKQKMKEELSGCWIDGNYTDLIDLARDEYNMSDQAINETIREFWKADVLPKYH